MDEWLSVHDPHWIAIWCFAVFAIGLTVFCSGVARARRNRPLRRGPAVVIDEPKSREPVQPCVDSRGPRRGAPPLRVASPRRRSDDIAAVLGGVLVMVLAALTAWATLGS